MARPADPVKHVMNLLKSNIEPRTIVATATSFWDMTVEEAEKTIRKAKSRLGREAEKTDILAEYMMTYHCQHTLIDNMMREIKTETKNAHFYNTLRNLIKDRLNTLKLLDEHRDKEKRNNYETPGMKASAAVERKRLNSVHFSSAENERRCGYFRQRLNMKEPGLDLTAEKMAERDIIRLRVLPKSPREDDILAEIMDALTEKEKQLKFDRNKLDDREHQTDIRIIDPLDFDPVKESARMGTSKQEQSLIAQRVFIERLRAYNETWEKAEAKVKGIMEALGIKLGFRHESVGLPDAVQLAAQGDPEAIEACKKIVYDYKKRMEIENREWVPRPPKVNLEYFCSGPFAQMMHVVGMLLMAFALSWACVGLVMGPGMGMVESMVQHQPDALARERRAAASGTLAGSVLPEAMNRCTRDRVQDSVSASTAIARRSLASASGWCCSGYACFSAGSLLTG